MATKAEVEFWKDMCRKLVDVNNSQTATYKAVMSNLNARSEELKSLQAVVDGLEWQVEDLQAENDKLRKLVSDMLPFAEVGLDDSCVARRCYMYEQCTTTVGGKCLIEAHMLDRMRELGVEVDG